MSKNSKAKRDKKRVITLKKNRAAQANRIDFDDQKIVNRELNRLFDPSLLTTPSEINTDILSFCAVISDEEPYYLTTEPEPWSRQSSCDLNVKEYIKLHGGEIVCGYRLWYNAPRYIEAERHAIWQKDGAHKDISFSADGENRCLFLPDRPERQFRLEDNVARIRWGKDYDTKKLIAVQEEVEIFIPQIKMSDEQSWNTMLSYEEWQNGKRMPSMIPMVLG